MVSSWFATIMLAHGKCLEIVFLIVEFKCEKKQTSRKYLIKDKEMGAGKDGLLDRLRTLVEKTPVWGSG